MQKLTIYLFLAACILNGTQAIAHPYKIKAIAKDGPAYQAEIMTAARNKREAGKQIIESPLFNKDTVSVLVVSKIPYINPGKKDPHVLEAELVDARVRLVCRPRTRVIGTIDDDFWAKFSVNKMKDFKRYKDHRKATIFEFEPSCFDDTTAEIRFYADVQNPDESYRYSAQKLSEKTKKALIADLKISN